MFNQSVLLTVFQKISWNFFFCLKVCLNNYGKYCERSNNIVNVVEATIIESFRKIVYIVKQISFLAKPTKTLHSIQQCHNLLSIILHHFCHPVKFHKRFHCLILLIIKFLITILKVSFLRLLLRYLCLEETKDKTDEMVKAFLSFVL